MSFDFFFCRLIRAAVTPGAVGRVGVLLPAAKNKPRHPPATSCHLGFGLGGFSRCILFFYEYLAGALRAPEDSRIYKSGMKRATAACGRAFSNALEETNRATNIPCDRNGRYYEPECVTVMRERKKKERKGSRRRSETPHMVQQRVSQQAAWWTSELRLQPAARWPGERKQGIPINHPALICRRRHSGRPPCFGRVCSDFDNRG